MEKYIVTKEEIDEFEGVEKVHFLNTQAQRRNKSLGDLTGLQQIGFHLIEIEPGFESTEQHVHYFEEECVYILEGEADAVLDDEVIPVKAGDFLGYRVGGKSHKLINNGTQTLKCIVVGQRLPHDVADYTKKAKRIYRNQGMPWNLVDLDAIDTPVAGKK